MKRIIPYYVNEDSLTLSLTLSHTQTHTHTHVCYEIFLKYIRILSEGSCETGIITAENDTFFHSNKYVCPLFQVFKC